MTHSIRQKSMHAAAVVETPRSPAQRPQASGREIFAVLEHIPGRVRDIAVLRGLGYSYREIASPLGLTPQAVSLMLIRHKRCLKQLKSASDLHALSARAVNVLTRHGITTRQEARAKGVLAFLKLERNCGSKTAAEIERWTDEDIESSRAGTNSR